MAEQSQAHHFGFVADRDQVSRLRDFPFGVGHDEAGLLLDRHAEFGIAIGHAGAGGEQPE